MDDQGGTRAESRGGNETSTDFGSIISTLRDEVRDLREDVGHVMSNAIKAGRSGLSSATDRVHTQADEYLDDVVTLIQERPLLAVGIAFGVGFLLARLSSDEM